MSVDIVPRRSVFTEKDGKLSHDADVWLNSVRSAVNAVEVLGTFADNVAALAGGLVAGQVYQTATGELRVVV